jgi:deoxyribodipyrimidine photo-lyase
MATGSPVIVWFRKDLRVSDNSALFAAQQRGTAIIPLYIWCPEAEGDWVLGAASRWWLHHSLLALNDRLRAHKSQLVIREGDPLAVLADLIRETKADALYCCRRYEPGWPAYDQDLESQLKVELQTFSGTLLFEPWSVERKQGGPFQVFTPFWNACRSCKIEALPELSDGSLKQPGKWPASLDVNDLGLLPTIDWAAGLRETWQPGELGGQELLKRFVSKTLSSYAEERNRPDLKGTSRLSPHLAWGEISPHRIWQAVAARVKASRSPAESADVYLSELGWREFAYHLLHHFPRTTSHPLREQFAAFPWSKSTKHLEAWRRGLTGYPIVDAGMRELWYTGWMHNRVRMIVASFLTKDLLIPWQSGAAWFWDTLVDADLASNTLGWQWTAGCGADAAPYFRIFNPVTQGQKFDPEGEYARRWVPELSALPDRWIHEPWAASEDVLEAAGVELGSTYPRPVVDHAEARKRALAAYEQIKRG